MEVLAVALRPPVRAKGSAPATAVVPKYSPDELVYEVGKLIPNKGLGVNAAVDYVREIEPSSKVDNVASSEIETLVVTQDNFGGLEDWLKGDDQQPAVSSFQRRGANHMMSKLREEERLLGVISSPHGLPEEKQAVERLGGRIDLLRDAYPEKAEKENLNDREIMGGQGTVAPEIVERIAKEKDVHAIFVPIGDGGLVSGITVHMRALFPDVKIIGVEPSGACSMALSFQKGERVELEYATYDLCKQLVDGVVVVEDKDIAEAKRDVYYEKRSILEFSGALAVAGAKAYRNYESQKESVKGKILVAVATGANLDFLNLEDVVNMAGSGFKEEAVLGTKLPE